MEGIAISNVNYALSTWVAHLRAAIDTNYPIYVTGNEIAEFGAITEPFYSNYVTDVTQ
jgi:hypothetical protein